ncbi:hypothetical protein Afil01_05480 [Actinorhabdospora filicis]|uniref:Carrier domain-containing protein n=1 Tax=Actinorhabdospora filicis TaxID=1785913 RepID=A0A9W6W7Q9_9ACTN|nr:acyl carrier protein [Actinorhabdospora filicis]GLZ75741.1 hypothetical protein Afil01_05480 [Actinorhabdospora filicis]
MSAETDAAVIAIIEDVLNAGAVTPADDFYEFGGTSLQAVRICVRVQTELGRRVEPDALFDGERIADFLAAVAAADAS